MPNVDVVRDTARGTTRPPVPSFTRESAIEKVRLGG
jgi:hypothetical protein